MTSNFEYILIIVIPTQEHNNMPEITIILNKSMLSLFTVAADVIISENKRIKKLRGCPACFLILKGVVISSHETNRFS